MTAKTQWWAQWRQTQMNRARARGEIQHSDSQSQGARAPWNGQGQTPRGWPTQTGCVGVCHMEPSPAYRTRSCEQAHRPLRAPEPSVTTQRSPPPGTGSLMGRESSGHRAAYLLAAPSLARDAEGWASPEPLCGLLCVRVPGREGSHRRPGAAPS